MNIDEQDIYAKSKADFLQARLQRIEVENSLFRKETDNLKSRLDHLEFMFIAFSGISTILVVFLICQKIFNIFN